MPLTKMTTNVNNIQALSDRPNTIDGLTSAELKEKFDKAGADLKDYLNTVLTEELDYNFTALPTTITTIANQAIQTARATEYPIGRIIMFYDNLDHSNYLGFTWERCMTGKVPVGIDTNDTDFNTIGKTGGEKTHKHLLPFGFDGASLYGYAPGSAPAYGDEVKSNVSRITKPVDKGTGAVRIGYSDYSSSVQPYEVVSYWKRIS